MNNSSFRCRYSNKNSSATILTINKVVHRVHKVETPRLYGEMSRKLWVSDWFVVMLQSRRLQHRSRASAAGADVLQWWCWKVAGIFSASWDRGPKWHVWLAEKTIRFERCSFRGVNSGDLQNLKLFYWNDVCAWKLFYLMPFLNLDELGTFLSLYRDVLTLEFLTRWPKPDRHFSRISRLITLLKGLHSTTIPDMALTMVVPDDPVAITFKYSKAGGVGSTNHSFVVHETQLKTWLHVK